MEVKLSETTLKDIRETPWRPEVAVLPWGACEPHGLHLPYGCDFLTAEAIASLSAQKAARMGARVVVLPTIPYGVDSNMMGFPLTVGIKPSTQLAILEDIRDCLETHGIRKMVILNAHGGNDFKAILREMYAPERVWIFLVNWWNARADVVREVCEDTAGDHANEPETSWFMYLYPGLVRMEDAENSPTRRFRLKALEEGTAWTTRPWDRLTADSGTGDPRKASAEKGKEIVEKATDRIAAFLKELSEAETDETFPFEKRAEE